MSRSAVPSKRPASDAQEAAWVADEDRFVLQQSKTKAAIRVKGGRAQPIDWLAVTLAVVDPERNTLDELETGDLELRDLEAVFDDLDDEQLKELVKGIDTYLALEKSRSNHDYWTTMKTICQDRRQQSRTGLPSARGLNSVASDLDKLLAPKSLDQLEKLEKQIQTKLSSNEPIDTDYWEHLLKSLLTYKAKAKLRKVTESIANSRLGGLRKQQAAEAVAYKARTEAKLHDLLQQSAQFSNVAEDAGDGQRLDPEPLLRLRSEDKSLDAVSEEEFRKNLTNDRQKVLRQGYVSQRNVYLQPSTDSGPLAKRARVDTGEAPSNGPTAFDREVARGLGANEEVFTEEEEVTTKNKTNWADQYRPRKPKYFNRVQTGYEWNKYNQTHYDQDNPPPKVVQGYKFNVFYPDLADKTKAPTYKIEREGGRKRGQSFAPAGEDDTCLIRFTAGPPYEDVAFRIVDKEWDYSAKRERGFKSSFDKGILQLHFQFKKIFYRK